METLAALDGNFLLYLQDHVRNDFMTAVMRGFTFIGDNAGLIWIVLALVLIAIPKTRRVGIVTAVTLALNGLLNNLIIKNIVNRTRPYEVIGGLEPATALPTDSSFPSGHSAVAFGVATAFLLALPIIMEKKMSRIIAAVFYVIAGAVAFSRLYLGVHYPSDVLTGIILGTCYAVVADRLCRIVFRKWDEKKSAGSEPA